MKLLSLVDASSILYRCFFALPPMSGPSGQPTQALFGFSKFLLKQMLAPLGEYTLVAFDGSDSKKRRTELWPAYKAHRQKAPDDLRSQMDLAPGLCRALGWPYLEQQGEEADDIIASACKWALSQGAQVKIFSQDKDLLQLVGKDVQVIATHKGLQSFDSMSVREQFGVLPEQLGDWLALVGDASDNIPGVPGIGPKKATQLLSQFGTLPMVLSHADQVGGALGKALSEHADQARVSRQLVELFTDISAEWTWSDLKSKPPDQKACQRLFKEWNFQSLVTQLARLDHKSNNPADELPMHGDLFGNSELSQTKQSPQPATSSLALDWRDVTSQEQWVFFKASVRQHSGEKGICALQLESKERITPRGGQIPKLIALSLGKENWMLDIQMLQSAKVELSSLLELLFQCVRSWATDSSKEWYHLMLQHVCAKDPNSLLQMPLIFDVSLASYVLQKGDLALSPSDSNAAADKSGKTAHDQGKATPDKPGRALLDQLDQKKVLSALLQKRMNQIVQLAEQLPKELESQRMGDLFERIEQPLVPILALMEHWGIQLDVAKLNEQRARVVHKLKELELEIIELAGEPFNLNSPKQLAHILFDRLGLHPPKKIATGFSTNAAALEILRAQHPIAAKLLEYRGLEKLRSTYIEALPASVHESTGRIHPRFMQMVTATGRLSCQDPNLQNIPIRSDWGKAIRSAFVARQGCCLVSADYSQIELRLMAHFSEDAAMVEAFRSSQDIHALTAAQIFHVSLNEVTESQRSQAKTVNFGIIYGQQAFGLAAQLGIDRKTADSFIKSYFLRYPGVARYIDSCKRSLETSHTVQTLFGRRRIVGGGGLPRDKNLAHRLAINSPIQGTGADLMKLAMIEVQKALIARDHGARMLLQIHDELLFECPIDQVQSLREICVPILESAATLRVPLIVNVSVGNNWAEC